MLLARRHLSFGLPILHCLAGIFTKPEAEAACPLCSTVDWKTTAATPPFEEISSKHLTRQEETLGRSWYLAQWMTRRTSSILTRAFEAEE
jgi:hypothetical protein